MDKRDFLTLGSLQIEDFENIFLVSQELKKRRKKEERIIPLLKGKFLGMIFEKPSTRTRVSFQVAMEELDGRAIYLSGRETQLGRGETVGDTAKVLSGYLDILLLRTFAQERVEEMAKNASIPVINGLSDFLHPCQVISDIFTIKEKKGEYKGIKVVYVGDGNNVCHSWILAYQTLDFELVISTPPEFQPQWEKLESRGWLKKKPSYIPDPYEAVKGAEVLYTDVWTSMGMEREEEREKKFFPYQVNSSLLARASPECLVMHCLPAHRGKEITDEVLDGKNSVVWEEAENRLHVQKGIILWCMEKEKALP